MPGRAPEMLTVCLSLTSSQEPGGFRGKMTDLHKLGGLLGARTRLDLVQGLSHLRLGLALSELAPHSATMAGKRRRGGEGVFGRRERGEGQAMTSARDMETGEAQGPLAIRHPLLNLRCHPAPPVKVPKTAPHMLTGASRSAPGRLQEEGSGAGITLSA